MSFGSDIGKCEDLAGHGLRNYDYVFDRLQIYYPIF